MLKIWFDNAMSWRTIPSCHGSRALATLDLMALKWRQRWATDRQDVFTGQ
jgi:hypothetical protein